MNIAAGQTPFLGRRAASLERAGAHPDGSTPIDLALPWTPTERAFWDLARDLQPPDFLAALDPSHVDAALLRQAAPSGRLLDLLRELDVTDIESVDDLALLEVVAAWQRVVSAASAGLVRAAAALSHRDCLQVPAEPVSVDRGRRRYTTLRATGTEIAIRLGCSVRTGELLARDGRLFEGALTPTGDALDRGEIDPRKAHRIADRLAGSPLQTALEVQDAVLPGAGLRSPAQVDRDLARALIEVDPTEAEDRHRRAKAERRVHHPRVMPDGMAGIWAVLPAERAVLVDGTLDAAAAAARAAGDPRTLDQPRADGFVDLVIGAPATGAGGSRATCSSGGATRECDVATRPGGGANGHGSTGQGPGGVAVPAESAELDHTIPFGPSSTGSPPGDPPETGSTAGHGTTSHDNLAPLCAPDHTAKTLGVMHLVQDEPGTLEWTTATGLRVRVVPGKDGEITLLPIEPPPF